MADKLEQYRRMRDPARTPEPVPAETRADGQDNVFVIQQHHARRLHWDLRLERGGVLVSWAVPRGIPRDPNRNHLAVHTEDHPMEYADFSGEIPAGEYGGGRMTIHDRGTYRTEKWRDNEVIIVLEGARTRGRYVLFQTDGKNWMIHRMDPPDPGWTPMPDLIPPMTTTRTSSLPPDDDAWAYELRWPGKRALSYVSGGVLRLLDAAGLDITNRYPELRGLAESLAPVECVLDGVVIAFDDSGAISTDALRRRSETTDREQSRRLMTRLPVQYLVFDLLWHDGASTMEQPYTRRRQALDALVVAGTHWQTPPYFEAGGRHALEAARAHGIDAVVAKRLDSPYQPGERTWLAVPTATEREVVIVGWRPRDNTVGTLLIAEPDGDGGLRYAGRITTGLTREARDDLLPKLRRLTRRTAPIDGIPATDARNAHWVTPKLTGRITNEPRPRWQGLHP